MKKKIITSIATILLTCIFISSFAGCDITVTGIPEDLIPTPSPEASDTETDEISDKDEQQNTASEGQSLEDIEESVSAEASEDTDGTTEGQDVQTNSKSEPEINSESDSESETESTAPECNSVHDYSATKTHHYINPCKLCGFAGTSMKLHNPDKTEISSSSSAQTYITACLDCGEEIFKTKIPDSAKLYYNPWNLCIENTGTDDRMTAKSVYLIDGSAEYDNGVLFARWQGTGKTGQVLWQRVKADVQNTDECQEYSMDVGEAKYLVIRLRTNSPNQSMSLSISTNERSEYTYSGRYVSGVSTIPIPLSAASASEWTVYVMDLTEVAPQYYIKDTASGTYKIDSLYFHFDNFASNAYIDVEYMAFVEGGWENIAALTDEKQVIRLYYEDAREYKMVDTETGEPVAHTVKCPAAKVYDSASGSTKYEYYCSKCGILLGSKKLPSTVSTFIAPTSMYQSNGDVKDQAVSSGGLGSLTEDQRLASTTHFSMADQQLISDGYETFFRFTMGTEHTDTAQLIWCRDKTGAYDSHENYTINIKDSNFAIIKFRTNDSSQNVELVISTENNERASIKLPVTSTGWKTYVIDLDWIAPNECSQNINGDYVIDTLYLHIPGFEAGETVDVAYIAFAKAADPEELLDFVDKNSVYLENTKGSYIDMSNWK